LTVNSRISIGTAIALCALVAGIVIAPAAASAQSSAVDQYVPGQPNPPGGGQGPESGGGGGGDNNPGGGGGNGGGQGPAGGGGGGNGDEGPAGGEGGPALSPSAGTGETDAGSLPFTGYPLTALLLIVLILLVGGVLVRYGPAGVERLRGAYDSR
jgi:hypothetical protein